MRNVKLAIGAEVNVPEYKERITVFLEGEVADTKDIAELIGGLDDVFQQIGQNDKYVRASLDYYFARIFGPARTGEVKELPKVEVCRYVQPDVAEMPVQSRTPSVQTDSAVKRKISNESLAKFGAHVHEQPVLEGGPGGVRPSPPRLQPPSPPAPAQDASLPGGEVTQKCTGKVPLAESGARLPDPPKYYCQWEGCGKELTTKEKNISYKMLEPPKLYLCTEHFNLEYKRRYEANKGKGFGP